MINFRKMVDQARTKGIFDYTLYKVMIPSGMLPEHPQFEDVMRRMSLRMFSHHYQHDLKEKFFRLVEKAHSFLFHPADNKVIIADFCDQEASLDLPFETCLFERIGQPLYSFQFIDEPADETRWCMLIHETAPKSYEIFSYETMLRSGNVSVSYCDSKDAIPGMLDAAQTLINEIGRGKLGREKVKERVKIGSGSNKRVHEIRTLIHVVQSLPRGSEGYIAGHRNVDWTHRWEVRGHWRDLPGRIGKNRQGEYCVDGKTWVRDTVKGPEDMPLVSKTRLVE